MRPTETKGRIRLKQVGYVVLVLIVVIIATVLYFRLTPDNYFKNNYSDKWRAAKAGSQLTTIDPQPLGDRAPWIWVHDFGLQSPDKYGPPPEVVMSRFSRWRSSLPVAYRTEYRTKEDLFSRVKLWYMHYDADRDPLEIGRDLEALIEGNSELTSGKTRITLAGISHGGRIIHCYQLASGGRKIERVVTCGSPHTGVALADRRQTELACNSAYPLLGDLVFGLVDQTVDFETAGMKSMLPGNPEMEMTHRKSPIDDRWVLYGGMIEPDEVGILDKVWTALSLADALLLRQDDTLATDLAYPIGARIIHASGDTAGSDGLVSIDSAQATGLAQGATIRTFEGYNHRNMLEGLDGDMEFFYILIGDLVTFEPE